MPAQCLQALLGGEPLRPGLAAWQAGRGCRGAWYCTGLYNSLALTPCYSVGRPLRPAALQVVQLALAGERCFVWCFRGFVALSIITWRCLE